MKSQIANLLDELRKFVLMRAPLKDRLLVLRHLVRLSGEWNDDLEAHEQERLHELDNEFQPWGINRNANGILETEKFLNSSSAAALSSEQRDDLRDYNVIAERQKHRLRVKILAQQLPPDDKSLDEKIVALETLIKEIEGQNWKIPEAAALHETAKDRHNNLSTERERQGLAVIEAAVYECYQSSRAFSEKEIAYKDAIKKIKKSRHADAQRIRQKIDGIYLNEENAWFREFEAEIRSKAIIADKSNETIESMDELNNRQSVLKKYWSQLKIRKWYSPFDSIWNTQVEQRTAQVNKLASDIQDEIRYIYDSATRLKKEVEEEAMEQKRRKFVHEAIRRLPVTQESGTRTVAKIFHAIGTLYGIDGDVPNIGNWIERQDWIEQEEKQSCINVTEWYKKQAVIDRAREKYCFGYYSLFALLANLVLVSAIPILFLVLTGATLTLPFLFTEEKNVKYYGMGLIPTILLFLGILFNGFSAGVAWFVTICAVALYSYLITKTINN